GQPDPQRTLHVTQSNGDVGAALAGVPAAAVDVVDERAAVRGRHLDLRAVHRGARRQYLARRRGRVGEQLQPEERTGRRRLVVVEGRRVELPGDREVQPAVAVGVGDREAARRYRHVQAELRGDIRVPSAGRLHE